MNNRELQEIIDMCLQKASGYTYRGVCPVCKAAHERSFAASNVEGVIRYMCHRGSCGIKGIHDPFKKNLTGVSSSVYNNISGVSLPEDISSYIPSEYMSLLNSYYIDIDYIRTYSIGYSNKQSSLIIPTASAYIARSLSKYKYKWYKAKSRDYIVSKVVDKDKYKVIPNTVCIVEDAFSCMRVGNIVKTIGLLGTHLTDEVFNLLYTHRAKIHTCIVWLDGDKGGVAGAMNIKNKLSTFFKCSYILSSKDPKYLCDDEIINKIEEVV